MDSSTEGRAATEASTLLKLRESAGPPTASRTLVPAIEGFRCLLTVWVMGVHYHTRMHEHNMNDIAYNWANNLLTTMGGVFAVDFFFIIAGFVAQLDKEQRELPSRLTDVLHFMCGKIRRLAPQYHASFVVALCVHLATQRPCDVWPSTIVQAALVALGLVVVGILSYVVVGRLLRRAVDRLPDNVAPGEAYDIGIRLARFLVLGIFLAWALTVLGASAGWLTLLIVALLVIAGIAAKPFVDGLASSVVVATRSAFSVGDEIAVDT